MSDERYELLCGDALDLLRQADDRQVRCVVTSPPYYGLRSYGTGRWEGGDPNCKHRYANPQRGTSNDGSFSDARTFEEGARPMLRTCRWCGAVRVDQQIGLEPSVDLYVQRLVEVFREVHRVLTDDGTVWLNLGDSYVTRPRGNKKGDKSTSSLTNPERQEKAYPHGVDWRVKNGRPEGDPKALRNQASRSELYRFRSELGGYDFDPKAKQGLVREDGRPNRRGDANGLKHKDLIGVPWRVAFALQADGWYLRDDIIWCLSGGAWLYAKTQRGEAPAMLKDLTKLKPETVKLWNGTKWTQVMNWQRSSDRGTKYELVLRSGERIGCTGRHLWPTQRGNVTAEDLVVGDSIKTCVLPEPDRVRPGYLFDDMLWFAGLYLADGRINGHADSVRFDLNADEEKWVPRLRRVVEYLGGSLSAKVFGNSLRVLAFGQLVQSFLYEFVAPGRSEVVHIQPEVWGRFSNADLRLFAEGYLDGDGHYDRKNNRWRLGFTRNYALERDLRVLAARVGATVTLHPTKSRCQTGLKPSFRGEWRWSRSGHYSEKDRGEVIEIRRSRARQFWDVEVEDEPHLFALSSGVLTHNSKSNPLPESVKDRPTRAHEFVFLLSKSPSYYYDYKAIQEPAVSYNHARTIVDNTPEPPPGTSPHSGLRTTGLAEVIPIRKNDTPELAAARSDGGKRVRGFQQRWDTAEAAGSLKQQMRNKRDVWHLGSEPYKGAHMACMPSALVEPCVLAGSAPNDLVLDPFCGSGTVGVVALRHGRRFVGMDLQPNYLPLAHERIQKSIEKTAKEKTA